MRIYEPKKSKYGNRKTVVDGVTFDSLKEASRWQELKLLERAGAISGLRRQVPLELCQRHGKKHPARKYVVDFVYVDAQTRKTVYEDAKGFRTDIYKLKRDWVFDKYGIEILET